MADGTIDLGGRGLLDEVRELYEALDPVPDDLADDVRIAITVEALEAELAQLVASPALAVRAADETAVADTITFSSGSLSLMVSFDDGPDGRTVDGWVTGGAADVEVHVGDEVRRARADEFGRFVVTDAPRGRTWFVVRRGGGEPPIVTPAVDL